VILRRRHRIEGMIGEPEAALLTRLASEVDEGCIVEIGSYRGMSTIALAKGARVPVYAIEPHEEFTGVLGGAFGAADRRAFFENLLHAGVVEQVRLVNLSSEVVAPGWRLPVGLLWIDGDHRYEAVRRDFECWEPHLRGVVAFHDAIQPTLGPARLIGELLASGFELIEHVQGTKVLQRSGLERYAGAVVDPDQQ
jgi:predicted O-methyltransferase YrrM